MSSKTKNKPVLFEFDTIGETMDVSSDDEPPAKDEAEEKLERLLFGDDDGFQTALKDHRHHGVFGEQQTTDLVRKDGRDGMEGDEEEEEGDMADMADADVFLFIYGILVLFYGQTDCA